MAFDQTTRNRLQGFVSDARETLTVEFTRQLQQQYGLNPKDGSVTPVENLRHLDDAGRETARLLRDTLEHYAAASPSADRVEVLGRIVREQAFTVLNRLAALRMAEARGILAESVSKGYDSKGFRLYLMLASTGHGETGDAYRSYLFSIFDEFALDLNVLFDRFSPQGRLFPREAALLELLGLMNDPEVAPLWGEDETIGWIYQYFNSREERKKMRDDSPAPRNSRELAVRNQFFTPRYVVEFLTDNTLGRIWYEMTRGETRLKDRCRYMVRRPQEIFLGDPREAAGRWDFEYVPEHVPPAVQAAYRGDFDAATTEEIDLNRRWIALAIPPDQFEKVTGLPSGQLHDYPHLGRIREALDEDPGSPLLKDPARVLAAFREFALTRGGEPHAVEPAERLWEAFKAAVAQQSEENLSQEELLRRPVYIPHRRLKDPRALRILDPACGSMHFGLYAYDLLEVIYEEAWELEERRGADEFEREAGLSPLRETFVDKEAYLREVPRLIIEHNLHGIDIDPRAVQIAGLSLWLRAQRAWGARGVKPSERPEVRRSNIVCAEPMPGESDLLNLSATPELRLLGQLVRHVFEAMKLAGEAGSLLKIEAEIADAVAGAKRNWLAAPTPKQDSLFAGMAQPEQQPRPGYEVAGITDEAFWERAEKLIYEALQAYAEQSESGGGGGYQRRLFADDAARGFAFTDLCRKRYDVTLMNPPFGEFSIQFKKHAADAYPDTRNDIFAAFTERMLEIMLPAGIMGAITSRAGFFLTSFRTWRENVVLEKAHVRCVVDLGEGIMDDAMVEAAAYCFEKNAPRRRALFLRALTAANRETAIQSAVDGVSNGVLRQNAFYSDLGQFHILPDTPLVYWSNPRALTALSGWPTLKDAAGDVRQGLATADDPRFARAIWEVPYTNRRIGDNGKTWVPYVKAGASQPWFSPITLLVNWGGEAAELWGNLNAQGKVRSNIWMLRDAIRFHFFKPGFSWTRRAVRFIPYIVPEGCIPSASRYMAFPHPNKTFSLIGLCASNIASVFLRFYGEKFHFPNYMVETVKLLPWPRLSTTVVKELESHIETEVQRRRRAYQNHEPFHEFALPSKIWSEGSSVNALEFNFSSLLTESIEHELNVAYGLDASDVDVVSLDLREALACRGDAEEDEQDEKDFVIDVSAEAQSEALLSYVMGCAFGRWDMQIAAGDKPVPDLLDAFAPLPVCPPGMLQNEEGLPAGAEDVPENYPLRISWPGILVDDPGHAEDVEGRAREVLQVIWPERADDIEQETCEILGVRSLREYFRKPHLFFAHHLKRYSKSRRQAPIYWPLSTPSGSYTLWLYYHRLDAQTLYACVVEFVEPKLRQTNDALAPLRAKANRARDEERELERLQDFALELQSFRDELLRLAQLPWRPNLNDGVQITAAPLWQLFRLTKWRKTLKETWQKLEKGDYDWAHLAMTIRPERVVPKCVEDRSLAIAHGVEDLFWVEDAGVWRKLRRPEQEVEEQKKRRRTDARERVRVLLGELAAGEEGNLGADEVGRRLAEGAWDDREVGLLLYPGRVADACWENPNIARRLNIQLPARRAAAARAQFTKKLVKAGCPDIADRLESALRDRAETFRTLWEEMERGGHDDFEVAAAFWPERVVDKCAEDASLAERHGIRRFLWRERTPGEWRRREHPDTEVSREVARRRGAGRREGANGWNTDQ